MQKSQEPLPVGKVIRERYLIKNLIGQGGSGSVYLVQDQQVKYLEKDLFALKEVNKLTAQEIYQFAFSGVALRKLHHPALARIIEIPKDEKQERVYLLMEYIEGPDLDTVWQQQPEQTFPWAEVKTIMSPIIDAVDYLHNQQPPIVHRDIKPINIILSEPGKDAILVDFGIVRTENATLEVDDLLSTYKAPEVFGNASDARADIYGLGATCYTLLTGTIAPPSLIRLAQVEGGNADPLQPANSLLATIPQAMAEALQKAMALEPSNRFSSAKQFWAAMCASDTEHPASDADKKAVVTSFLPKAAVPPSPVNVTRVDTFELARKKQAHFANVVSTRIRRHKEHFGRKQGRHFANVVSTVTHYLQKQEKRTRFLSSKKAIIPLIAVALLVSLLSLSITANFWPLVGHLATSSTVPSNATHTISTPDIMKTSIPTTPSASTTLYANIAGLYAGTIYNIVPNVSTTIAVNIQQIQGMLYGNVVLGPKIQGGGVFTGTIDTSKHLQLLVTNASGQGQATMLLQGSLQSSTSLSGEYYSCIPSQGSTCHRSSNSYGLWNTILMKH